METIILSVDQRIPRIPVLNGGTMDDLEINRFAQYLISIRKISAARIYKSSLRGFSFWLGNRRKTFDTFTVIDVQEYMSGIKNNSTANLFLGAVRGYMKFRNVTLPIGDPRVLIETQRENQLRGLKSRSKRTKRENVALTVEDLREFLAVLGKMPKTPRNELVYSGVILHWYFGARPVELGYWLRTCGCGASCRDQLEELHHAVIHGEKPETTGSLHGTRQSPPISNDGVLQFRHFFTPMRGSRHG